MGFSRTLAPRLAAPNASARPAPPAPRTRNVFPSSGDGPEVNVGAEEEVEAEEFGLEARSSRSIAPMAADQSVLYPLKEPSGC